MKTSRFILTMVAAFVLAVFIPSCGLPSDLAPSATQSSATATAQATLEPDPSSTMRPSTSIPTESVMATSLGLKETYPPNVAPTAAPTIIEPATPTPIPASWETFSDSTLNIQFRYPAEWQARTPLQLSGTDGFVEVSLLDYHASLFDVMRTVCVLEANTDRPAAFGAGPLISNWSGWDAERQAWTGNGCTVIPSDGMSPDGLAQAVLYARYPPPQMPDKLLVLRADAAHFTGILSTLRFQDYTPSPTSSGYYYSPACDETKVGGPQVALRTEALVITETAIANKSCDPWLHFDGFQNLVNISGAQEARKTAYKNGGTLIQEGADQATTGADRFAYEYASSPLFPVGSPSQVHITRNGQVVDTLAIPQAGPAGYPVSGFWNWKEHWLLEMDSVVVENGELLNNTLKYAEIFEWHLVNDEPFYFFQKDSSYGISYSGQELPLRYDDIIHGQLCCDPAVYSIISTPSGAWFYALKGDIWYMVQAQLK